MRMTEFWVRMDRRFGVAYAPSVARDQVLYQLQGRTAEQALEQGVATRDVWRAICDAFDVPARDR